MDYTLIYHVLNSRLEEFERLNTHSKKVNVPPEKTAYIQFYPTPTKARPQKMKVSEWSHPPPQWDGKAGRKELSALPFGPQEIEYQDLRFPTDLSNPFAVATVLNQEAGKLKIKELKQGDSYWSAISQSLGQNKKEMCPVAFIIYEQNSVTCLLGGMVRNLCLSGE